MTEQNVPDDPFANLDDNAARILPPDFALKRLLGDEVDIRQVLSPENIEKAQAVIDENKGSFLEWVMKDIEQLNDSYRVLKENPAAGETEIRKLARAAFIIKSQAGTFGFALATVIAKSLDDFCSHKFQPTPDHMIVVHKHIETLMAIFAKNITGDGGKLGSDLVESLAKLVSRYKDR